MMKALAIILSLAVVTSLGWSQASVITREIKISPVVSTTSFDSLVSYNATKRVRNGQHRTAVTTIDSFHTDAGSAVVKYRGKNPAPATAAASVAALQNVDGSSGIMGGSYLLSIATGDTLWTLSDTASRTGSGGNVNSDTLSFWAPAKRFSALRSGQRVVGTGVEPFQTLIDTVEADSNGFSINQKSVAVIRQGTLRTGAFTSLAYTSGDALGFPFIATDTLGRLRDAKILQTVVLIDSSKQAGNCELVLFESTFTPIADNAAFSLSDADAFNIVAVIPISTWYTYGDNSVAVESGLGVAVKKTPLYGQLVARGTPTFLSATALKLRMVFVTE